MSYVPHGDAEEDARLESLLRLEILDTGEEAAFDALARLAARITNAPFAGVCFVDSTHVWLKSRLNIELRQHEASLSFCRLTIRQSGVFVVEDARYDPRFESNPYVHNEPFIRFYAGAPLTTAEGARIGCVCVMDSAPRPGGLSPQDAQALEDVAHLVMDELNLRLRTKTLARQNGDLNLLRAALDQCGDAVLITEARPVDQPGPRIAFVNSAMTRASGYSLDDLIGKTPRILQGPTTNRASLDAIRRAMETWSPVRVELRNYRKDGSAFDAELDITPVRESGKDSDGWFTHWVAVQRDITEKKAVEQALRAREEHIQMLFESAVAGMAIVSLTGNFIRVNSAYCEMTGYSQEELLRNQLSEPALGAGDERQTALERDLLLGTIPSFVTESRLARKDGSRIWARKNVSLLRDKAGHPLYLFVITEDITGRRAAEQALEEDKEKHRQTIKLEAIGQLVGGIAHEFNNFLTVMTGYSTLLANKLPRDSPLQKEVSVLTKAAARAAAVTKQLLTISRKQVLQPKVLDINECVNTMVPILTRLLPANIRLSFSTSSDLLLTKADAQQVEQLILNLAINARDAMPGGGTLQIQTSNVVLDKTYARSYPDLKPGDYVLLSVTDDGCGMDEYTKARAFEPFFTTKAAGSGTGLGLAMAYGMVKQSGGHISLHSEPGMGTSVHVYFAVTSEMPAEKSVPSQPEAWEEGKETILLAEDDPDIRNILTEILTGQGFHVSAHPTGEEAFHAFEQRTSRFDLVITDIVMPRTSGDDLIVRIREIHPRIPVVYISAFFELEASQFCTSDPNCSVLIKPFTPDLLLREVRRVLDKERNAGIRRNLS